MNSDLIGATVKVEWEHLDPIEGVVTDYFREGLNGWMLQPWWAPHQSPMGVTTIHNSSIFVQNFARMSVIKEADKELPF